MAEVSADYTERVLAALPGTVTEVVEKTGLPRNFVRSKLARLARSGAVTTRTVRNGRGWGFAFTYERADQ
ncbi:MAG: hypothetical protein ACYDAN_12525 [Candidatus Limnocylindrales bacterium]